MKTVRTAVWKGGLNGAGKRNNLTLLIEASDPPETVEMILELRIQREDETLESDRRQVDRDGEANMTRFCTPLAIEINKRSWLVHKSFLVSWKAIQIKNECLLAQ
jgi:hypothetical protein